MAREKSETTKKREALEKKRKSSKLGTGERFKAVEESAKLGGAKNPSAVAAMVGRKKYGQKKMTKMAVAGKKKK